MTDRLTGLVSVRKPSFCFPETLQTTYLTNSNSSFVAPAISTQFVPSLSATSVHEYCDMKCPLVTGPCGVPLLLSSCHLRFPGSDVPSVGEPPIASKCFRFVPFSCRLVSHDWSSHYSSDAMLKDFVQRHGLELSSRSAARNPTPGSRGCGMPASCLKRI